VSSEGQTSSGLVDREVNPRVLLAVFWVCHFILWIFGDMFTLLQEMGEPVTDSIVLLVAPTTAIVLTLMVVFCLVEPPHLRADGQPDRGPCVSAVQHRVLH